MIARWQEDVVRHALKVRRAVHLTGVRQCGKTTLAERFSIGTMLSLDRKALRLAAQSEPDGFVMRRGGGTMVIDEIQKVPELLEAIKVKVDRDNAVGQYLLTGSSNLRFMKAVKDSLAGRLQTIRLRTLTLGEIVGGAGTFLSDAFAREFRRPRESFDKRGILRLAFSGGYPESREMAASDRRAWYLDYLHDLLVKDIRDVTEIRKVAALGKVAQWLLAHSSKFFDLTELCAKSQLSYPTLLTYLEALKALYVFDELPAWAGSDYAKIGRRSKWYASDAGLVANLLDWDEDETYYASDECGKLVETWVYHELSAQVDRMSGVELTQYRDSDKREIDFVVENAKGDILGVEVKVGTVSEGDFSHLKWFREHLAKKGFTGIVLYSGDEVLSFGGGLYAVPLACLAV